MAQRLLDAVKASNNFMRVVVRAREKLGDRIDDGRELPPRIARKVLDEAQLMDSPIGVDYLSGILVGSRTSRV